jgi:hypothetical protein
MFPWFRSLPSPLIVRDSPIHVFPMPHFEYGDIERLVVNQVNDSVAYPISVIVTGQIFAPMGSWVFG